MSESSSDNKEVIEGAVTKAVEKAAVKKSAAAKKPKAAKKTVAKKDKEVDSKAKPAVAKKAKVSKPVAGAVKSEKAVVSKSASENAAPYMTAKQEEETESHRGEYFAAAAAVLLILTLTVVTFYDEEFKTLVAGFSSTDTAEVELAVNDLSTEVDQAIESVQVMQPNVARTQANYGYQPFAMDQPRNNSIDEMRKNQRAAYEAAVRQHNERMAESRQLRTAAYQRMDQDRINRQQKMETMRVKTQQIQLEMQQKMQAAFDELHAS